MSRRGHFKILPKKLADSFVRFRSKVKMNYSIRLDATSPDLVEQEYIPPNCIFSRWVKIHTLSKAKHSFYLN